jgi:hypothetical protein
MRRLPTLAIAAAVSVPLSVFARSSAAGGHGARLVLRPSVTRLRGETRVAFSGIRVPSLQVRASGASDASGNAFGWQPLRLVDGNWVTRLEAPARRGVYPLAVRVRPGTPAFRAPGWFLRVLARGSSSRPSFAAPVSVVRWWVRTVPRGTVVAVRSWPLPDLDRRDSKLHRLFVVAYSPPGHSDPGDRRGIFVTAFRLAYGSRWRFLEAKLKP